MFCVGLTGGIGSGKTTVSEIFNSFGITIVDTDVIAREIVEPGTPCLKRIEEKFSDAVIEPDGSLNRKALREIIFSDADAKHWLEDLMHPLIRDKTRSYLLAASSPYVILSSPLLLESPDKDLVDRVCIVDIAEDHQVHRTHQRDGVSRVQIQNTIASQMPRNQRISLAEDIIDNGGTIEETQKQVAKLHHLYLHLAKNHEC